MNVCWYIVVIQRWWFPLNSFASLYNFAVKVDILNKHNFLRHHVAVSIDYKSVRTIAFKTIVKKMVCTYTRRKVLGIVANCPSSLRAFQTLKFSFLVLIASRRTMNAFLLQRVVIRSLWTTDYKKINKKNKNDCTRMSSKLYSHDVWFTL